MTANHRTGTEGPEETASLADNLSASLAAAGDEPPEDLRREAWNLLDRIRRTGLLQRIPEGEIDGWSDRILDLVLRSHFTVGPMFRQRVEAYGSKVLFRLPSGQDGRSMNWRQVAMRVEAIARGLLSMRRDGGEPGPVAILSENRLEMALVDLACLTSGIVNVMIPANSTRDDVGYMLRHSRVRTAVVSTERQLAKVLPHVGGDTGIRDVILLDPLPGAGRHVRTLDEIVARSSRMDTSHLRQRSEAVRIGDLATVMYTSGTTGNPKGIQFSHLNLVFKRFARALALPEIGDEDVFLSYLPLYHTFGRYLELLGSIFWGATYCFLPDPSPEALIRGMRQHTPSVFISVPRKWMQLYEAVKQRVNLLEVSDGELASAVREVTGGRLRWGLSAAGHLDPEIFRFFQSQGIELMSGFGMTEATGGITMTPPGGYKDGSLGRPLPGIETRLGEDGELLIRGPYVTIGYLDPPEGETGLDADGWLATGDLMEEDRDGFIRLVDRKKEIYKNVKGETIAPQRVENLFRGIESVETVFLVGDHREYNTALIHPNPECVTPEIATMSPAEVVDHFRSVVVSVNSFLAPYERIVDFAIIDRPLDPERGELTPKGTPRRMNVERNFADVVRDLYHRSVLRCGGLDVDLPNWLFQALGLTARDILVEEDRIVAPGRVDELVVRREEGDVVRVGSCLYRHGGRGPVNLGAMLTTPALWLGNPGLVDFFRLDLADRQRSGRMDETLSWHGYAASVRPDAEQSEALETAIHRAEADLDDIHLAALLLFAEDPHPAIHAVRLLEEAASEQETPAASYAHTVLRRAAASASVEVRRRAFQVLALHEKETRFPTTLQEFLQGPGVLLDAESRQLLCERDLSDATVNAFLEETRRMCLRDGGGGGNDPVAFSLLEFLASFGACHPAHYRRIREVLTRILAFAPRGEIREKGQDACGKLLEGFRQWLGPAAMIAVDPETGQEYRWDDVVVFDENVEEEDRERLLTAIKTTPVLREGVFLFSGGISIRLSDIPPGGVWIRTLGRNHGKTVYRTTVRTRFQGSYDLAVNVNHELDPAQVREEIRWLVLCSGSTDRPSLVEEFGGYWQEADLWTEEFITGETLHRALRRISRRHEEGERLRQIWPFFAWMTLNAYVEFWDRTGRMWEIADTGMGNVVVPTHDYHTGSRLVSISLRRRHRDIAGMLGWFRREFIAQVEKEYPELKGAVGNEILFSSILEVLGEAEGIEALQGALQGEMAADLRAFLDDVELRGFLPSRLYFAVERYHRWARLNVEPTLRARARTMREIFETYGLRAVAELRPETRARFFRETVFRNVALPLAEGLDRIVVRLQRGELDNEGLADAIADLRAEVTLEPDEDFFLARLSFPHLRPEDTAVFVDTEFGDRSRGEMVMTMEDRDGNLLRIRHALNPREVARLHRLFLDANLEVHFRQEHRYLVALNDRNRVIGGIYYDVEEDGDGAHLEKIVVAGPYRRCGIAEGLMNEFFNRLRDAGVTTVTTGFFRPEYFYTFDFKIEKKYAGLVKKL